MAGVVESLKSAGGLGIAIFILAFVGNICNWVAFTTASWARKFMNREGVNDHYTGYGLWRECDVGANPDALVVGCKMLDGTNVAHYGAVQGLVSIGFLGVNAMFLIIVLKMFTSMCSSVGDIDKVNGIQAIITAHYGAVQGLVSIGFLGLNIMFFIIVLKMFTGMCSSVGDIDKVNGIQAIVTGIIYLIGIIIFGVEYGDGVKTRNGFGRDGDLGYSFILAVIAMFFEIVVGIVLLVTGMKGGAVGSK